MKNNHFVYFVTEQAFCLTEFYKLYWCKQHFNFNE